MKFYESGDADKPTILLIPGTCCHWSIFNDVTPLLHERFRTVAASFDGFDETEDSVYPTMEEEAGQIERYVAERLGGQVLCCYGCSLGGSYAAYLVQRGNIRIGHAILGSSDMDEARPFAASVESRIATRLLYPIVSEGKVPGWLARRVAKRRREDPEMGRQLQRCVDLFTTSPLVGRLRRESIYNQFYWDLVTPIERGIDAPGTAVHVFYATGMGPKYERRYLEHFAHPDIRRQDMNHETFFFCHPQEWAREIADCCGLG